MLAYGTKNVLSVKLDDYDEDLKKSRSKLNAMFKLVKDVENKEKEVTSVDKHTDKSTSD